MNPTIIPLLLQKLVVNLTRVTDAVYWQDDAYTNPLSYEGSHQHVVHPADLV
ncbi:hypothetical protein Tsubulata_006309 [Turnera subulata]|uniref:Uncharacterized protein n=1 Tax=Turnera subulata TaxID=218843 RepID=A0A9Q0G8P9_9ROSI|nr:hypothetical protein Tsubulata_006309 [Turnera subulata]